MSPRMVGGCAGGRDAVNGERAARCLRRGAPRPGARGRRGCAATPGRPTPAPITPSSRCLRRGARPPVTRSPGDGGGSPAPSSRCLRRGARPPDQGTDRHTPRARDPRPRTSKGPPRSGASPSSFQARARSDRFCTMAADGEDEPHLPPAGHDARGPGFFPRRASGRAGARAPRARRISALAKTSPSTRRPSTVRVFGSGTGSPARGAPRRCQASPSTRRPELAAVADHVAERSAHPRVTG